jgi:hypothetical protein
MTADVMEQYVGWRDHRIHLLAASAVLSMCKSMRITLRLKLLYVPAEPQRYFWVECSEAHSCDYVQGMRSSVRIVSIRARIPLADIKHRYATPSLSRQTYKNVHAASLQIVSIGRNHLASPLPDEFYRKV